MKIFVRPLENFKLLGTKKELDSTKVYEAFAATNQPDYEEKGLIFVDDFLLSKDEYEIVIVGKRSKKSWEKQTIWNLSNGWVATEEWNQHYGSFIKRLDGPNGKIWLASNGEEKDGLGANHYNKICKKNCYVDLPDFAKEWCEHVGAGNTLVKPNFEKNTDIRK